MPAPVRCITFNLWADYRRPQSWLQRRDAAANIMRYHRPDVLGLQEAQMHMIGDLHSALADFEWCGAGRDDGVSSGEFTPIFYRRARFERVASDTFWLRSGDTHLPGKGWDAACVRIATWARLRDRESDAEWFFLNTHLDHMGRGARRESARLLVHHVQDHAGLGKAVLMGDLNCRDTSMTYRILTTGDGDPALALQDARAVSSTGHHGPDRTWRGFLAGLAGGARLDYILVKNGVSVLQHATLSPEWNGIIASDHLPVMAELSGGAQASGL